MKIRSTGKCMEKNKSIVYIGDFDLRNENVQAHLVKNNGKILNKLGYTVVFVGINRYAANISETNKLPKIDLGRNLYLELPNTLNFKGLWKCRKIIRCIISYINNVSCNSDVQYVISYQAPTYSVVLKYIAEWCKINKVRYIVNCADLPIFDNQPFIRRSIMKINWHWMHKINHKYADGIISVSGFISEFYFKKNRPSVIIPPLFDEDISFNFEKNDITTFLYAGTPFATTGKAVNPKGMKDRLDKVIELFLQLSKRNVRYRFVIVGITKEAYLKCVPQHKEALEKEKQIEFAGKKPHDETLSILTRADFMINIRDKNLMTQAGLSTKVVESVSVGTPVVMNPIGDTFNYLYEGVSGFALDGSKFDDMILMERLCLLNADERIELKRKCLAQQSFSLDKYQDKMSSFLQQVLQTNFQ